MTVNYKRYGENRFEKEITGNHDDDCSYHEYDEDLFDTYESLVWDVNIINDRFLTVDVVTYTMGVGGVHSYGTNYQLVYDLESGMRLTNKDIFKGTEEKFKTLMAQKTREYAEADPDEADRFFTPDPEEIYKSAYEIASFEDTNLQFFDDHLELVYLHYEIAPYAAGVFNIDISYEDFIGANTLTIE